MMHKYILRPFPSSIHIAVAAERPNILFISVDDMNRDSVGEYGALEGHHAAYGPVGGTRMSNSPCHGGNCYPGGM